MTKSYLSSLREITEKMDEVTRAKMILTMCGVRGLSLEYFLKYLYLRETYSENQSIIQIANIYSIEYNSVKVNIRRSINKLKESDEGVTLINEYGLL